MITVEELLKPVSDDQPCGPDLAYDPRFEELETILKGKPEVEIGSMIRPAEPPDWGALREKSAEFLGQSKNLRAAVMLACSCLRTQGLPGFRDGLQLIRGLLEKYWPAVYPLLDAEDNNDPTQRLNTLESLTLSRGEAGLRRSWLAILDYLYAAPLCQPKGGPPIVFDQVLAARLRQAGGEGAPADAPDPAKLAAAFRAVGPEQIAVSHTALQQALEALQGIDQFLTTTLGAGKTSSFDKLETTLKEMVGALDPYLAGASAGAEAGGQTGVAAADSAAMAGAAIHISGAIRSREDVVRALDGICQYYDQVEPGSPVPFLLRRAQKLAAMNFVQAMKELNLATVEALRPSMGSALPKEEAAAEPPSAS